MKALSRQKRSVRRAALGGAVLLFVLIATGLTAALFPRPALGAQTTLTILSGTVAVKQANGTFGPALDGELVQEGTTIRTGPDANAVLTFFDGSTVTIAASTEFTLQTYTVTGSGDLLAEMTLAVGSTWHVVAHALSANSKYEVHTNGATASVRGTAFTLRTAGGRTNVMTTEGTVNTAAGGSSVDVHPQQETDVESGQRPSPPVPAPPPPATVKIVLDATSNAVVMDQHGRSVGVQNGQPVRYIPGSTVLLENGKLVLEIPQNTPGRLSTVVRPDVPTQGGSVEIQTEVLGSNGSVIADTVEKRTVDQNGSAKGGVVITTKGVLLLPDSDAQKAPEPNLGAPPPAPTQSVPVLFGPRLNKPIQLLPLPGQGNNPNAPGAPAPPPLNGSAVPGGSNFLGAFQQFTADSPSGGNAPVANANLVRFTTAVPAGFIPPPPPGRTDSGAPTVPIPSFVVPPLPSFLVPPIDATGGAPVVPGTPPGFGTGPATGGFTQTGPFQFGSSPIAPPPAGCTSDAVFGVACGVVPFGSGVGPATPPTPS
ncbi:MAG: FecR family protein, partial [Candidatus Limnocylindria bacterium]